MKPLIGMFAGCCLAVLTTGCSQNQAVVRGQSPMEGQMMPPQMAYGGGMEAGGSMQMPGPPPGPMYYDGPAWGDCPTCPCPPNVEVWRPTHHHTWEYNPPQGLTYPQANQPPAVVQYPYYTVKGPTDFFWQGP